MPTVPPYHEFDRPTSMEELEVALSQLKKRKTGGKTGILQELLLCGGPILRGRLLQLMQDTVDGERFAGLNIRGSALSKFSRKYFHVALAISTHYLV